MFVCLQMTPSHYPDLSEDIDLLKACQVYAAECVSKAQSILPIIFYLIYGTVCLQLTQFCDDHENVYFMLVSSSNRKYESLIIA